MYVYLYIIHIERKREIERQRNREHRQKNRKEVWFDFHLTFRGKNMGLSLFSKN